MNAMRVTDLTVDELAELIRKTVRQVIAEEAQAERHFAPFDQSGILDIPTLEISPWPVGLESISRADMYGDDER